MKTTLSHIKLIKERKLKDNLMYKTIEPGLSKAQLQLYLIWSLYTLNMHKKIKIKINTK